MTKYDMEVIEWEDIPEPIWNDEPERYRIKPDEPEEEKPVTHRELARWLAQGNGEYKQSNGGMAISTVLHYWSVDENTPAEVLVRKWEDTEWHEPTRKYMGLY